MRLDGTRAGATLAATCLAALAATLTGCGGDSPGNQVKALTEQEVRSAAPDTAAMPGWKAAGTPHAVALSSDLARKTYCAADGRPVCAGATSMGLSTFTKAAQGAEFWVTAYRDEAAAKAAYEANWTWNTGSRLKSPQDIDLGALGDRRDAARGTSGYTGRAPNAAYAQVRVGTCIAAVSVHTSGGKAVDGELVEDLAEMFTDRVRQVQNGDTPSAKLDS